MTAELSLSKKVDILFQWGEDQGLNVTYKAVAEATGETWTNFNKIRRGENANPGLRTVEAMARYFNVRLDYFNCQTESECWAYLKDLDKDSIISKVKMRANGLSPAALNTLDKMIENVLQFLDQVEQSDQEDKID